LVFSGLLLLAAVSPSVFAGRLVISVNDGKNPMVDGVYKVANPAPPDTLTILDVASFPPKVVGETEVHHSVIGPPVGVAVNPDETLALVSIPNKVDPNDKTKLIFEDFLQVIDLEASPPAVIDRIPLPGHPWGVSINRFGDLALVAQPTKGTISVFTIDGKKVTPAGSVTIGDENSRVSHVAISPDNKWALATKRGEDTVAVLKIDGAKVEYTKRDITTGSNPYVVEISFDGRLAAVANVGRPSGDADSVTIIDMTRQPFRAVEHVTVGPSPEGIAISPDSQWLAVGSANGTNRTKDSPFRGEKGKLSLFSLRGGKATLVGEAPTGQNTQGLVFTPNSQYILVQNYIEKEIAAYKVTPKGPTDTGVRIKLKGYPASIRTTPR
ncbi:MAG TPA: beta-propeller fold lactonase family protein, partial [Candidatus Acidoferrum sp.]|nr:beta-propeller fold lactonase family protein [Candidatus Acidoferrum sp.]